MNLKGLICKNQGNQWTFNSKEKRLMEKQIFMPWKEEYSVGIPAVDEQHQELVKLTNELHIACLEEDSIQQYFMDTIHKTLDYTAFHFSTEERLMKATGYPDFAAHKREHDAFVQKVVQIMVDSQKFFKKKSAPYNFVSFLQNWILDHIAKVDKAFGEYMRGLKKEE
jgi:hemerythrin